MIIKTYLYMLFNEGIEDELYFLYDNPEEKQNIAKEDKELEDKFKK